MALSDEADQTVRTLGEKLFLESNTLTPILKKLEADGYLQRRRDPADERQVRLTLTPAGQAVVDADPGAALTDTIGLGDAFGTVQQSVAKLRDNLLGAGQPGTRKD